MLDGDGRDQAGRRDRSRRAHEGARKDERGDPAPRRSRQPRVWSLPVKHLTAAFAGALVLALPAAAEPPAGGSFTPGGTLAGVELGLTRAEVLEAWGDRHGVCRECEEPTWYFNERPFRPEGTGVVFEQGRVVHAFTVWQPEGWTTPEGLELGAPAGDIGATYGELAEIDCGDYLALVDNALGATSAYYVHEDEVWGFGLLARGRSPCV
ncbi:MAG TPA: hypothetical protein VLA87_09175 [Gaiellaceae bacterium]|nr:hypothetical protein [Gaiellaceae bacterium]